MKKRFLLMVAVLIFLAVPVRAEIMDYVGSGVDVQSAFKDWPLTVNEASKAPVCLIGNKPILSATSPNKASQFNIAFKVKVQKCSSWVDWYAFSTEEGDSGYIVGIPVSGGFDFYRFPSLQAAAPAATPAPEATQQPAPTEAQNPAPAPTQPEPTAPDPQPSAPPAAAIVLPDTAMSLVYVGVVNNPVETVQAMGGKIWDRGVVDVCIFPGYPVKTQGVDAQNRPIYGAKIAFRICVQTRNSRSIGAGFAFTTDASGNPSGSILFYRASKGGNHMFIAAKPVEKPAPTTTQPATNPNAGIPSGMIAPEDLNKLLYGGMGATSTVPLSGSATDTLNLARQAILKDVASRPDIDQILAVAQEPTTMVVIYTYKQPLKDEVNQTVGVEFLGGEVQFFGKILPGKSDQSLAFTSEQFRLLVYSNKVEKIAADGIVDGSFKFVQFIDNNAGLPAEKRESTRTGRFAGVKACDAKDCIPSIVLKEKKLNLEVPLCDVAFTSNRHPAEIATLKAWQTLVCKK